MLNIFAIQFLAPFAYLLLRFCLGVVLVKLGVRHYRHRTELAPLFTFPWLPYGNFFAWYVSMLEILFGILFVIGYATQFVALLTCVLVLKFIVMHKRFTHPLIPSRLVYVLMGAISLSLFITGAGVFAFDLPI